MYRIKLSSPIGKNVDYKENLKFNSVYRVEIFIINSNVILKRSLLCIPSWNFNPSWKSQISLVLHGFSKFPTYIQKQTPEVFYKKAVLKNSQYSQEKTCAGVCF